ncbi:MAG TPA: ABC transporter permease subunit [Candidatus Nitrosocosmicus sp.]|nr:ABC transporter permease subunit [Candidatus Nitrosocosmicus sp.]
MGIKNQQLDIILLILSGTIIAYVGFPFISILNFLEPSKLLDSFIRPQLDNAFILSLITSTISTLILIIFGISIAYCLARYDFRGKLILQTVVIFPLILPPLASGALLLGIFSPSSALGSYFPSIDFTQSVIGIVIAQTYVSSPFMILTSQAAFEAVDRSYELTSRVLGKSKIETFFKVTLPMAKAGIMIGILLTWVRSIGELGATMMMAYNPHTISIQIFEDNAINGLQQAMPDIMMVILLSVIALTAVSILKKKDKSSLKVGWN